MSKKILCFVHIERAGGTTLHHIFQTNYPMRYVTINPRNGNLSKNGFEFSQKQFSKLKKIMPLLKGIGGHTTRSYLNYENTLKKKELFYITFLRDPIKRYMSHYNFHLHRKKINWTIEEFLERKEFNNFQTIRLAGVEDLELAKNTIENKINFIGITELFDESLVLLQTQLNKRIRIKYERRNSLKNKELTQFKELPDNIQQRIIENNKLDISLFEFAKELLDRRINEHQELFTTDLEKFREKNITYKPSFINRSLARLFKGITRFLIEPIFLSKNQ